MVIDLVIVTAKPPGSRQLISPLTMVVDMAPANVLHGALRLHGLASSPTPDTQVRLPWRERARPAARARADVATNLSDSEIRRMAPSDMSVPITGSAPAPRNGTGCGYGIGMECFIGISLSPAAKSRPALWHRAFVNAFTNVKLLLVSRRPKTVRCNVPKLRVVRGIARNYGSLLLSLEAQQTFQTRKLMRSATRRTQRHNGWPWSVLNNSWPASRRLAPDMREKRPDSDRHERIQVRGAPHDANIGKFGLRFTREMGANAGT